MPVPDAFGRHFATVRRLQRGIAGLKVRAAACTPFPDKRSRDRSPAWINGRLNGIHNAPIGNTPDTRRVLPGLSAAPHDPRQAKAGRPRRAVQ